MKVLKKAGEVEEFTRLIALISITVIVFGYGSLCLYYFKWGIPIGSYVDASEVLLAFTAYFYEIIVALFFCFLYYSVIVLVSVDHGRWKAKNERNNNENAIQTKNLQVNTEPKKKQNSFLKLGFKVGLFVARILPFLLIMLYLFLLFRHINLSIDLFKEVYEAETHSSIALKLGYAFLVLPMSAIFLFYRFYYIAKDHLYKFFLFGFLLFGLIYFYLMIDLKYHLTKYEISSRDVELVLDNGKIINTKTDSLIFIGSTSVMSIDNCRIKSF